MKCFQWNASLDGWRALLYFATAVDVNHLYLNLSEGTYNQIKRICTTCTCAVFGRLVVTLENVPRS